MNARLSALSKLGYFDGQTPLMAAAKSFQRPEMLEALLEMAADIHARSDVGINAPYLVRTAGQVEARSHPSWMLLGPCEARNRPFSRLPSLLSVVAAR